MVNHDVYDEDPEDDDGHSDSEEKIGMLYNLKEPAILSLSSDVRRECLPIYYGNDSFSRHFYWLDYEKSPKAWAGTVEENARLIRSISFEGRHAVEEGVEFLANVDLREHGFPFDVQVTYAHAGDYVTETIRHSLEHQLISALCVIARRADTSLVLSSDTINKLASIFVGHMIQ